MWTPIKQLFKRETLELVTSINTSSKCFDFEHNAEGHQSTMPA